MDYILHAIHDIIGLNTGIIFAVQQEVRHFFSPSNNQRLCQIAVCSNIPFYNNNYHNHFNNNFNCNNNFNNNFNNFNNNFNNNNQFHQHHRNNNYQNNNNNYQNNQEGNNGFNDENNYNYMIQDMDHLRGLANIASTCYMNSILQCFCNITEFRDYFSTAKMNQLAINNYNSNKLFPAVQEVVQNLSMVWDNSPYYPYNFKQRLGAMNPLFQGAYPNDAKDLLTFILLQLHEELNKPIADNNNNINNNNIIVNQSDKKLMFKLFSKEFTKKYRSIISALFFGLNYNESECFMHHKIYNYQTFNFIIFPLEKVLQYKIKKNNFCSNFNNTVTLYDCFEHYQLYSTLNDFYCNQCKKQTVVNYRTVISLLPNILIIILNRGKGLEFKVNISFENENLGLGKYVEFLQDKSLYELIGMVTHYGDSSAGGHFVARCKSLKDDGQWYLYNDQTVEKIGYFNKDTFAQGNPYILFYKKINFQN